MAKDTWIIANWKANKTLDEALEWVKIVGSNCLQKEDLKIAVCPSFSAIEEVKREIETKAYPLIVGAQDLSPFDNGAYTGEETAAILKQFVKLAILGHSERRENFGETDEIIAEKVKQALEYGITPLVCVQDADTLVPQGCKLIAYEPVFAIGSGNSDSPEDANRVAGIFKQKYGEDSQVLYGGSVTAENVRDFTNQENISGVLVGKASLIAEEFVRIIKA